ncbi:putative 5'-nucleotidase [Tieghemostelium lacteum]|uniref:Putative 5'-nucleotidase n=1 Tax=Tieghemostelium lacteum TaxID=361077 RepID=A0A151Z7Q1_TIELA|nr:putative 5'-nucleotidase [Tieghemostelium lacteum]|eukprot:KYQ89996.1 putative 5'-nucleotidase [Tieghemostelium lacteum]
MDSKNPNTAVIGECLRDLDLISFDMDMTLVQYNYPNLSQLIFNCLKEHLVTVFPFLESATLDMDFCKRGLVVDLDTGYFLKLDSKKRVLKAYDGSDPVPQSTVDKLYHGGSIDSSEGPLHHFNGNHSQRFFTMITHFEIPAGSILQNFAIHLHKEARLRNESIDRSQFKILTYHIVKAYDKHFDNFYDSLYYNKFREDPSLYVYKASPKCIQWLKDLKQQGTKVLLVTNSKSEYADILMTFSYGENYQQLFDIIITDAKKPEFFRSNQPFYDLQTYYPKNQEDIEHLKVGNDIKFNSDAVYKGGNVKAIIEKVEKEILEKEGGVQREIRFCYVGDNLMGDIVAPKQYVKWMTIAIIDEVDDPQEMVYLKQQHNQISSVVNHSKWGNFFYFYLETTLTVVHTFWSTVISENADIVLSSIDTLVEYYHQDNYDIQSPLKPCAVLYK